MYEYRVEVVRVVDGDTVDVDIDLGFGVALNNQRIRLAGIDAPETRTRDLVEKEAGLKAKACVEVALPVGSKQVLVTSSFDDAKGKYGRIIGDLKAYYHKEDRHCMLNEILLTEGLADLYE